MADKKWRRVRQTFKSDRMPFSLSEALAMTGQVNVTTEQVSHRERKMEITISLIGFVCSSADDSWMCEVYTVHVCWGGNVAVYVWRRGPFYNCDYINLAPLKREEQIRHFRKLSSIPREQRELKGSIGYVVFVPSHFRGWRISVETL